MEDGVKSGVQPIGMAEGTVISVEHLFKNTPARLAFQRRPETETARIVDVVVDHAGSSFLRLPLENGAEDLAQRSFNR